MASRCDAKSVIDKIRKFHRANDSGGAAADANARSLSPALDMLSTQVYTKSTHFILELMKNADNNTYAPGVEQLLALSYREDGYLWANVKARSDINDSTKKVTNATKGYIGEKAVGFKSVFNVANAVWISTGYYTFRFARDSVLVDIDFIDYHHFAAQSFDLDQDTDLHLHRKPSPGVDYYTTADMDRLSGHCDDGCEYPGTFDNHQDCLTGCKYHDGRPVGKYVDRELYRKWVNAPPPAVLPASVVTVTSISSTVLTSFEPASTLTLSYTVSGTPATTTISAIASTTTFTVSATAPPPAVLPASVVTVTSISLTVLTVLEPASTITITSSILGVDSISAGSPQVTTSTLTVTNEPGAAATVTLAGSTEVSSITITELSTVAQEPAPTITFLSTITTTVDSLVVDSPQVTTSTLTVTNEPGAAATITLAGSTEVRSTTITEVSTAAQEPGPTTTVFSTITTTATSVELAVPLPASTLTITTTASGLGSAATLPASIEVSTTTITAEPTSTVWYNLISHPRNIFALPCKIVFALHYCRHHKLQQIAP
nr:hypothetical protein B0A51_10198 [Rachicladosporium sp. CCFEE 5018]